MSDQLILLDISIWELSNHPDNTGKYQLAISFINQGSVTFGPQFKKKSDAKKFLSSIRKHPIMTWAGSFALMRSIVDFLRRNPTSIPPLSADDL